MSIFSQVNIIFPVSTWDSAELDSKLKIQSTLFPEGLLINPETREYRTKKMNGLISVIVDISKDSEDLDKKKATQKVACLL